MISNFNVAGGLETMGKVGIALVIVGIICIGIGIFCLVGKYSTKRYTDIKDPLIAADKLAYVTDAKNRTAVATELYKDVKEADLTAIQKAAIDTALAKNAEVMFTIETKKYEHNKAATIAGGVLTGVGSLMFLGGIAAIML